MINEQTLTNQNLPLVQQRGNLNCAAATGESTTGVSQDRYREIIGGNPNNDPITVRQLNNAIEAETGRTVRPYATEMPTNLEGATQIANHMNRGNNFYVASIGAEQTIGHATALNSVTMQTYQRISGTLYNKIIYQVMDPAQGTYRTLNIHNVKVLVRIYP